MNFYIYDVVLRIGGGINIYMVMGYFYGNVFWWKEMSMGRRVVFEIKRVIELDEFEKVVM